MTQYTDDNEELLDEEDNCAEPEMYEHHRIEAENGQNLLRVDKFLMTRLPNASRTKIQEAADAGNIRVNGNPVKSSYKVKPRDIVTVMMAYPRREIEIIPEDIPLDIVYEDEALLVVNKPAGMVVHPSYGHYSGTLVNALASFAAALQFDNFRKLEGNPFATAFCTGNMRSATEHAMHSVAEKDVSAIKVTGKYFLIIFAFLCGVLAGYYASQAIGGYAAFIPAAVLFLVFICILIGNSLQKKLCAPQTADNTPSDAPSLPAEAAPANTSQAETAPTNTMESEAAPTNTSQSESAPTEALAIQTQPTEEPSPVNLNDKEKQS